MSEPALALQKAVFDALGDSARLGDLVGTRIRDRVPAAAPEFPYLTLGEDQILDDGTGCGDAWEAHVTVHVWSRDVGMPTAKAIAAAVRDALAREIAIAGFRVVEGLHRQTRYMNDPDGLTTHAVVEFRYLIDPA